jgi:heterodisulfide reductase subunit B
MTAVKTAALLSPICDAQHQQSQYEEIRNVEEYQENEVGGCCSERVFKGCKEKWRVADVTLSREMLRVERGVAVTVFCLCNSCLATNRQLCVTSRGGRSDQRNAE